MPQTRIDVDYGVWGVVKRVSVIVSVACILSLLALWYLPIIKQSRALERDIEARHQALAKQQQLQQTHIDQLNALRTEHEAVERALRENLRYARPDEKIYRFESSAKDR